MRFIDSHAHLDIGRLDLAGINEVLARAWTANLVAIVAIAGATRPGEYRPTLELAEGDHRIWVAAGIHPHIASSATVERIDQLRFALDHTKVVALGEIGLDYHYNHSPPAVQRKGFVKQLQIAHKVQLPVVIHTREAEQDTLSILRDEGADELDGVIHCFSSTPEFAEQMLKLGFYLSFSGIVTFPKARAVQEVAALAPADRILAETDTPFLSPSPHRGKRNEPARVVHVVAQLAKIRKSNIDEMGELTVRNAERLFALPPVQSTEID